MNGTRLLPTVRPSRRFLRMTERDIVGYARTWPLLVTGLLEPLLYLLSIGLGVGGLVGDLDIGGRTVSYAEFAAPGMLATAAMNGATFDTTFNFFIRLRYGRMYDAVLATPLEPADVAAGEIAWSLLRGTVYSTAFLVTMAVLGLAPSPWTVAALPAAVLVAAAFASAGLACGTFLRSVVDFDIINLVLTPLFLFSATFFPLSRYPEAIQWVVRLTPLYQGVELCRSLTLGQIGPDLALHGAYLLAMVVLGVVVASRRIDALLRR